MSSTDSFFLILTSITLSLFFLILIALAIYAWTVMRRLVKGAEAAMSGVEAASNVIRQVSKRGALMPLIGLVKYLFRSNNTKS